MAVTAKQPDFSVGDVVQRDGDDTSAAGRVCRVLNFGRYCVQFPVTGCRRVPGSSLRMAPPGTSAPNCTGCYNC